MKLPLQVLIQTLLIIIFNSTSIYCQSDSQLIQEASNQFAEIITSENHQSIGKLFNSDSRILPEYHPTLKGNGLIKSYYQALFSKIETTNYSREPFEIERFDDLYLELGHFKHQYHLGDKEIWYEGKYSTYWTLQSGAPRILAHIWGSSKWFESSEVDLVYIHSPSQKAISAQTQWEKQIEESRAFTYEAVFSGDAKTQLISYHEDAIYMTYYDPPFIGKQAISEYFLSHYNPDVPMDSLNTRVVDVIDLGEYALKFGEYFVSWTFEGQPSLIRGKGMALFKRMSDGSIQIYRQMINHSMPPTLKSEYDRYQTSRILRHLDNQQIALDDYLSVYDNEVRILPPGESIIEGKADFKDHLKSQRKNGSISIEHEIEVIESYKDNVILEGSSSGTFFGNNQTVGSSFATKNLMVLDRDNMGQFHISKLIWNMKN